MSSSFPQFSVDEIILRHGSQNLYYFMIIHSHSITLDTATPLPGAHSVDSISYWFYLCLKCIKRFPESFSGKFRNNCSVYRNFPEHYSINWNFPEHYSVTFRNSRTLFRNVPKFQNNVPEISVLWKKIVPEFRNLFHNGNGKNFRIIFVRKP